MTVYIFDDFNGAAGTPIVGHHLDIAAVGVSSVWGSGYGADALLTGDGFLKEDPLYLYGVFHLPGHAGVPSSYVVTFSLRLPTDMTTGFKSAYGFQLYSMFAGRYSYVTLYASGGFTPPAWSITFAGSNYVYHDLANGTAGIVDGATLRGTLTVSGTSHIYRMCGYTFDAGSNAYGIYEVNGFEGTIGCGIQLDFIAVADTEYTEYTNVLVPWWKDNLLTSETT